MTDSLKFGPEWLRNMKSEHGSNTITTTVTAIKMAEFRYGREEMLALFDRSILAPDPLRQIQGLHVDKTQPPLALLQMTEEETRMWNRGINSDAALRSAGPKPGGSITGSSSTGGPIRGPLGGRGGSVDRGRGRGRGAYHYSRGPSFEDSESYSNNSSYSRNMRSFDRTQGQGSTQWSERNGGGLGGDHNDWSGGGLSSSPRKEYSTRSMSDTNWRRHRGSGEDDDGWRSSKHEKWNRSASWRDGDSNWESNRGSSGPTRHWEEGSSNSRKHWDSEDNALPEWATENPSESGGCFDASGAFHGGGVSDEDEDIQNGSRATKENISDKRKPTTNHHKAISEKRDALTDLVNGTSQLERIADRDKSKSDSSGLRQSQSASNIGSSKVTPERKTSVPVHSSTATDLTASNTSTKPASVEKVKEDKKIPESQMSPPNKQQQSPSKAKTYSQPEATQQSVFIQNNEKSEETMLRMQEVADDLIAKLIDYEDKDVPKPAVTSVHQNTPVVPNTIPSATLNSDTDKWFYRDPQGTIQGPFLSSEMAEWYKLGYFSSNLQVRRACDEKYSPLGELIALFGSVPFVSNSSVPPIKANDNMPAVPTMPVPSNQKSIDEALLLQQQYYKRQVLLNQQALFKQLNQPDRISALSSLEQQQLMMQQSAGMDLGLLSGYMLVPQQAQPPQAVPAQPLPTTQNSVMAMIQQLHQQQQQAQAAANIVPEPTHNPIPQQSIDPVQLIQQIGELQAQSEIQAQLLPQIHQKHLEGQRTMEQFLHLFANANLQKGGGINSQPAPPRPQTVKQVESVWGGTPAPAPTFNQNWSLPAAPPGQLPQSLWGDIPTKGMKTEQEILEEQLRAEEERKKEERRKQEEMQRLKGEEEEKLKKKQEEEELERKRKEEERERRRLKEEEERKKREAAEKKAEQERIKKEEEKKRKEEEKKRKEEQKRKQEEEKRRQEEEKKRQEEEKMKQEEERKRAEQAKRQAEALKRLQEQQQQQAQARAAVKPTVPAWTAPETIAISASLTEIQKTERKQQQQLREQQLMQLLKKQQQESQERNNNNNNKTGSSLNLKWADTKKPQARVKSLAEIQAEEQEQLAKQLEREKAERMAQAKEVPLPVASSIWANPNLTWNTPQNTSSVWGVSTATGGGNSGGGFWDDVTPAVSAKLTKPTNKSKTPNSVAGNNTPNKPVNVKNRAKKEEMNVLKLFEQQPKQDEFYNWCSKTLSTMQSSVDIPTFVQFLREIEHPLEIQEYIRIYLGEGKEAIDFASQFIERRSRAKTGEPQKRTENTSASTTNHFQEVKAKNKKVKKGKMMRVDNRILGFNVTASQDRFNVGDRDYGENI